MQSIHPLKIESLVEKETGVDWVCPSCGASNQSSQTFLAFCKECGVVCCG